MALALIISCHFLVIVALISVTSTNSTTTEGWIIEAKLDKLPPDFVPFPNLTSATEEIIGLQPPQLWCPSCLPGFLGGEQFYHSATVWTSLACGSSVCNTTYKQAACGPFTCDRCRCDDDCSLYGDCCPDTYITTQHQKPLLNISCVSQAFVPLAEPEFLSYKMVNACPGATTMTDGQSIYVDLCHSPDPDDVRANVPVYSPATKLDYKNRYCALCHGAHDVLFWRIEPFCITPMSLAHVSSRADILDIIRKQDTCAIHFIPPKGHEGRECNYGERVIDGCNKTGQWLNYDADIHLACSTYSQPVTYEDPTDGATTYYQNIFCASCNGVDLYHENRCGHGVTKPSVTPFSLLLNFNEDDQRLVADRTMADTQCDTTEIYDSLTVSCRRLFCPFGKIPEDHTCLNILPSAKGLGYIMHMKYLPRDTGSVVVADLQYFVQRLQYHIQHTAQETEPIFFVVNMEVNFTQPQKSPVVHVHGIDVQYSLLVGARIPRDNAEALLVSVLQRPWWWYQTGDVKPVYLDVSRVAGVSDDRHTAQTQNIFPIPFGPFGVIRNTTFVYKDFRSFDPIPDRYTQNTSEFIEVHELLLCNMIALNKMEYASLHNGSIIMKTSESLLTPDMYKWSNNTLYICADTTTAITDREYQNSVEQEYDVEEIAEIWLTVVCMTLSLLGLALTIGLYIYRRRIISLPGKNSMFLFVNIFLTQLLYLTGSSAHVPQSGCRALGIIIHYFMLASFCWKLICAFHMYWLLANPLKSFHQTKSFAKYAAFGQIVPLIIIALTISVNIGVSHSKTIGYGDRKLSKGLYFCFLSSKLDIAFGILLPIAFVIAVNLYFFCRIVYSLSRPERIHLHSSKSKMKESKVYLKMSLLFGFCWILGFIALAVNVQGLWFLFTLVNASIGVFIFLSFGVSNISLRRFSHGHGESSPETGTAMGTPQTPQRNVHNIARLNATSLNSSPADSPATHRKETGEH